MHLLMSILLSLLLLIIPLLIQWSNNSNKETKHSPFECGFEPLSPMRSAFSFRFIMLILLFLIFDIELVLLFPYVSSSSMAYSPTNLLYITLFLLILLVGLIHEWYQGSLDWNQP